MKKNFTEPKLMVSVFNEENVVTASGDRTAAYKAEEAVRGQLNSYQDKVDVILAF